MRKFIFSSLLPLVLPMAAWGDVIVLSWPTVPGATSYSLYQSIDLGGSWSKVVDSTATTVSYDAPADKLVLFRISARNSAGESVAYTKGVWYNGAWSQVPKRLTLE